MFEEVGKKIKGVAKVFCWIGIITSFLIPLNIVLNMLNESHGSKGEKVISLIICMAVLIIGPILAWLSSLVLYGFGELVDKADSIDNKLTANDE